VLEGRTGETASGGGTRIWAGRIGDSFYIDLSLLAMVNGAVANGTAVDLSAWRPENAQNSFASTHVDSIVLEVSHQHPQLRPGASTGVWCATKLGTDAGGWRQINRAGHPMMWPIFWPNDTDFSDPANTRHPSEDLGAVGKYIGDQIAAVVSASGISDDPQGYGQTVARRLFPDVLPYLAGTPATYSFAAFNGRTLADNAPEAMLSLVASTAVPSGLKPSVAGHLRSCGGPAQDQSSPVYRCQAHRQQAGLLWPPGNSAVQTGLPNRLRASVGAFDTHSRHQPASTLPTLRRTVDQWN
jgi:Domain of unknown function (DUF4331)